MPSELWQRLGYKATLQFLKDNGIVNTSHTPYLSHIY
jgi:hypothetical protein